MLKRRISIAMLLCSVASIPLFSQQAGDLDPSFGSSAGIQALVPESGGQLYARSVKLDDAGRIITVGTAFEPSFDGPVVVRLLPDGTPDSDFGPGADGVVRVDFPGAFVQATDFVIDDADRIVVVGLIQLAGNNSGFAAFRLSADGILDTTFGENGLSLVDLGFFADRLLAVELQRSASRQNIVAAGQVVDEERRTRFAVVRLLPDGSVDPSFGTDGLFVEDFDGWIFSIADDLLVENNRDLVVVGRAAFEDKFDSDFFAVALRRDGALDTRFGGGSGYVTVDFDGGLENGFGAAFDGQDIVAVGSSSELGADLSVFPVPSDIALVKLTRQGQLDGSFGVGGKLRVNLASPTETAWAVEVQRDGKIVAAGRSAAPGVDAIDIAVVRILPNGALDPDFGTNGFVKTDYLDYDEAYAAALQSDGKIVVAGYGGADGFGFFPTTTRADLLVVRYLGLGSLPLEIEGLQALVRAMASEGMVQRRRARSLISKLDLAIRFLERNGEPVALQFLRLFRAETVLATSFGQIEPAAGAELLERVDVLIASLSG